LVVDEHSWLVSKVRKTEFHIHWGSLFWRNRSCDIIPRRSYVYIV